MNPVSRLVLPIGLVLLTSCALIGIESIRGSGVALTEQREVDSFNAIKLSGALTVDLSQGSEHEVVVEGDDNLVPLITSVTRDGTLKIYTEGDVSIRPQLPLKVTITSPSLDAISVAGACKLNAHDLAVDSLKFVISGASKIEASGTCGQLDVSLAGASNLDLAQLIATHVTLDVSGASSANVHATDSISGEVSGAAKIKYAGTDTADISTSGVASVDRIGS